MEEFLMRMSNSYSPTMAATIFPATAFLLISYSGRFTTMTSAIQQLYDNREKGITASPEQLKNIAQRVYFN